MLSTETTRCCFVSRWLPSLFLLLRCIRRRLRAPWERIPLLAAAFKILFMLPVIPPEVRAAPPRNFYHLLRLTGWAFNFIWCNFQCKSLDFEINGVTLRNLFHPVMFLIFRLSVQCACQLATRHLTLHPDRSKWWATPIINTILIIIKCSPECPWR